jgi:hypothetical protein
LGKDRFEELERQPLSLIDQEFPTVEYGSVGQPIAVGELQGNDVISHTGFRKGGQHAGPSWFKGDVP